MDISAKYAKRDMLAPHGITVIVVLDKGPDFSLMFNGIDDPKTECAKYAEANPGTRFIVKPDNVLLYDSHEDCTCCRLCGIGYR